MAIGVLIDVPGATQALYDAALQKLIKGKSGTKLSDWPGKGLLMHLAGPTTNGWRVVDVWESEAAFKDFAAILGPILKDLKFPEIAPQFFPAHKFVKS